MSRTFAPGQLGSIEMFCKAAELQGFTAAAQVLGVTAAAVSRSVGRLEERLGAKLFTRTTRLMRLTEEGRAYFEQCHQALAQIENAERAINGSLAEPTGVLRISMPTTYGHHRVLPFDFPLVRNADGEVFGASFLLGTHDRVRLLDFALERLGNLAKEPRLAEPRFGGSHLGDFPL